MNKDFDAWNLQKKQVENRKLHHPKKREIWWANLGVNVGSEQDGVGIFFERPVLILKKFSNGTCLIVPLTKSDADNKFYFNLEPHGYRSRIILSQMRVISTRRLTRNIERLDSATFSKLVEALEVINGFCNNKKPPRR